LQHIVTSEKFQPTLRCTWTKPNGNSGSVWPDVPSVHNLLQSRIMAEKEQLLRLLW